MFKRGGPVGLALGTKRGKEMKRFSEILPASGLVLLFVVLMCLQLFGFDFVGRWAQTTIGTISLIFGLLILGLCITGPLICGVLFLIKRTRNHRP